MRSCLLSLLITIALLVVVLWLTLPMLAGYAILGMLNIGGFNGRDTQVEVQANPPLIILTGHADTVHLVSNDVSVNELRARRIDLQLDDVAVLSRHVGAVHGTLEGVDVMGAATAGRSDATVRVSVQEVRVEGPAFMAGATVVMTGAEAARLAASQLKIASGMTATVSFKTPDAVTIKSGGQTQIGHLVVKEGALLLVPDGGKMPTVVLMKPGKGNPFIFTAARVGTDLTGVQIVTLEGTIDIQSLLD